MKNLIYFSFLFLGGCQGNSVSNEVNKPLVNIENCSSEIYLDGYERLHKFHNNPDTVKLNSTSYVVLKLYNCGGEMDIQEFHVDSGMVLSGHYKAAEKTTVNPVTNYNADGEPTSDTIYSYHPIKSGIWEYYQSGKVVRTEKH